MISKFRIMKSLEWCTELPTKDCPRKSPVFVVNGNECFFLFVIENVQSIPCFEFYLELKCMDTEFKPCSGKLHVGFLDEETFSLGNKTFQVLEPCKKAIWYIYVADLQKKRPAKYTGGDLIKIFFLFDDLAHIRISEEGDDKSVQTPLYIDSSFLLEGVSKDLSSLLDESPNHDVEFICGDQAIKAHKNVLCCRSEVFATMLRTEMAEGKTGQIKIKDIECTVFKQFLRYLYTGVLPELTVDTALQIYEAADKYAVSALKKQCASFLVEHLSPENACELLIISDRHSDSDFKKKVIEYVLEEEIPFEGEILTKFCKDNSTLAAEVLNLFCLHRREKKVLS